MFHHILSSTGWRRTEPGCQGLLFVPGPSTPSPCAAGPLTLQTGLAFPAWRGCFRRWDPSSSHTHGLSSLYCQIQSSERKTSRSWCLGWNPGPSSQPNRSSPSLQEAQGPGEAAGGYKDAAGRRGVCFWATGTGTEERVMGFYGSLTSQKERDCAWEGKWK